MKFQKKLIALHVLRGVACLLIWISHIRVATRYFEHTKFDFIQVFSAWGKESVLVFFMLSGVVINLSSRNKMNQWQYFSKRFIRIYPIYLAVLLICFLGDSLIFGHATNGRILMGNLFLFATLQGYVVPTMPLNPAVWSISCEVFFYLIFGLLYPLARLRYIWIWFAVCCLSIFYTLMAIEGFHSGLFNHFIFLLNNSFLWILGYLVFEYRDKFYINLPVAVCGILMVPLVTRLHQLPDNLREVMYFLAGIYLVPFFIYLLKNYETTDQKKAHIGYSYFIPFYLISVILLWHYSNSLSASKVIYSLLPFLSFMLYYKPAIASVKWVYDKLKSIFRFIANVSYPLYLLHMPIMYMVYYCIPDQRLLGMILIIFFSLSMSYLFEIYLFRKCSGIYYGHGFPGLSKVKQDQL